MMDRVAYDLYLIVFWPLIAMLGGLAIWKRDRALIRCIALVALGQWAMDLWFAYVQPPVWLRQPVDAYLAIYIVSAVLVTVRPAGRTCTTLGGVFIAGVLTCVVRKMFGDSQALDWMFWRSNLAIGWMTLFVVIGGSGHERGRRILGAVRRRLARVADSQAGAGVAG